MRIIDRDLNFSSALEFIIAIALGKDTIQMNLLSNHNWQMDIMPSFLQLIPASRSLFFVAGISPLIFNYKK
jgi:hypothetical protein